MAPWQHSQTEDVLYKATTWTHIPLNLSRAQCKKHYAAIESETELQTSEADKSAAVKHNYTRVPLTLQCERETETARSRRLTKHSLKGLKQNKVLRYSISASYTELYVNTFDPGIRIYCKNVKKWKHTNTLLGTPLRWHTLQWFCAGYKPQYSRKLFLSNNSCSSFQQINVRKSL